MTNVGKFSHFISNVTTGCKDYPQSSVSGDSLTGSNNSDQGDLSCNAMNTVSLNEQNMFEETRI